MKGFFNFVLDAIDEFLKLLVQIASSDSLLLDFVDEIVWVVLDSVVDGATMVRVLRERIYLTSALNPHLQGSLLHDMLDVSCFALKLKVNSLLRCLFFNHLVILKTKLLSLFDNSGSNRRSDTQLSAFNSLTLCS